METDAVYSATTRAAADNNTPNRWFIVPNPNLALIRFVVKVAEVLLSFVAFILEEVVTSCSSCNELYFFEFVSCTAFLFTLLLLILLSTPLHQKVGIRHWAELDFVYSILITVFLIIASALFANRNGGSGVEKATATFGFLASFSFIADVFLFVREKGIPRFGRNNAAAANAAQPGPEVEKLNTNGTSSAN